MSASFPAVDRPIPSVAIVGTDAVLAAAPATPVQLAHACLQRGFTVAVPASWGDELVATEAVRLLASRERGPAVMCVCPFARARLLGPGADLAPFLVSLVPPPVAVARYLRSVYGEHGVHVTYIGSCPGADDPSIDTRLTPDSFLAELAERGISLSEQPLVFDSIVPPDRRRWCSLPGGVPNADVLSAEADGRTMVEIERDDVTTELAQHIIAREHVLLDLAPSLGCACSGAVGLVSPDRARVMVTAAEPPRALSPVIDPAAVVSLDLPVAPRAPAVILAPPAEPRRLVADTALERVLDEFLGAGPSAGGGSGLEEQQRLGSAVILDLPRLPPLPEPAPALDATVHEQAAVDPNVPESIPADDDRAVEVEAAVVAVVPPAIEPEHGTESVSSPGSIPSAVATDDTGSPALGDETGSRGQSVSAAEPLAPVAPEPDGQPTDRSLADESAELRDTPVRRRTPPAMLRYAGSSVPRATVANGRPLPRAYVAKRRTPPTGAAILPASPEATAPAAPPASTESAAPPADDNGLASTLTPETPPRAPTAHPAPPPRSRVPAPEPAAAMVPEGRALSASERRVAAAQETVGAVAAATPSPETTESEPTVTRDAGRGGAPAPARSVTHPAVVFLLVTALVALAVFVLLTLRR